MTFQPVWSGGSGDLDDLIFEGEEPGKANADSLLPNRSGPGVPPAPRSRRLTSFRAGSPAISLSAAPAIETARAARLRSGSGFLFYPCPTADPAAETASLRLITAKKHRLEKRLSRTVLFMIRFWCF